MHVNSEIDSLRKVIIHEPDFGIEKVTPEIAEELLYDDIVYLPRMVEEHRIFTKSLKSFLGEEHVLEFSDLLAQCLVDEPVKRQLLRDLAELESISASFVAELAGRSAKDLAHDLTTGIHATDSDEKLLPLPNLIFTRDLGVMIKDHLVICRAATRARIRESLLCSTVFNHHPLFRKMSEAGKVIDLYRDFKGDEQQRYLEGGDCMIVHPDHVLIGCSERTNETAIRYLAGKLMDNGIVKYVSMIHIPPERYCMHLDTIFTVVDEDACVGFKPLVFDPNPNVRITRFEGSLDKTATFDSVKSLIQDIYPGMRCIPCGGGHSPYQEREQWTDGSNLVALRSGVFYGYERNYHTSEELNRNGYEVESASLLNDEMADDSSISASFSKSLITLPSGELSRARGGSHCMTMPVYRI